ncbi:MAG TPA: D-2-hydroxyacid dehydrogenase [Vicinamibacteria bacterium]|nr:D-2-hydroxyacid dehydrogenase [Vicinamibacteria bacterium]
MSDLTVLVLARPDDPGLRRLERLPGGVRAVVGGRFDDLAEAAPQADVLLYCSAGGRKLLEQAWQAAPRIRWVHSRPAGVDVVLFPALVESAVPVTNSRGVFSRSLAEFVLAGVFFFAKDIPRMRRGQAAGRWDPFQPEMVRGRTLGIVGYGDIGRETARVARAVGMRVVALRRQPSAAGDDLADEIVGPERLHELLGRADYVVIATPLTAETRHLIGREALAAMPPHAVVINVGRGPVVDEAALIEALEQQRIRGAALDVFEQEPLPDGHPLYRLDNVLLSPHCADQTAGWQAEAMDVFLENLERFRAGQPLRNLVDKSRGY